MSLLANNPHQWKSMLTHQGWFNLLIYATFTRATNYRVCNLHIYLYPTPRRHTLMTLQYVPKCPFFRSGWNGNFRYKYLENHTVYFVENYMVVKLKYCIIRFYLFYFFKIINYHFNSEYFTFKLVVKLLSALSVNTVLAYRYFWLSVKSIWSFLTLSIERPCSNKTAINLKFLTQISTL